ncbi:MFS transporter [Verrucosispora sp. WMMA2121]|uniref:MFS transporter n=1 Tax=Verrucosispora sp. WMMA2121 TaxID=3015164 RepID=UPI0022B6A43B|nr:MFS transporter [Verrucosispora sp. WMMA2121]MCZ7422908.1 MFS transporter [Verrucosispora sp. WMMA2121]
MPESRTADTAPAKHRGTLGFLLGVALVTAGVLFQLPDVKMMIDHARMGSTEPGMPSMPDMESMPGMEGMSPGEPMDMWTPTMILGMLLLLVGLLVAGRALFAGVRRPDSVSVTVESIEHGRLRPAYWITCAVLTIALVVDIMKPLTLGFVMPGMSDEYGMSLESISILPLVALTGTAVGSVVWGLLGDRYGRRTALLLATLLFIATSACGAMPTFEWNLVMCFAMGTSAGGLLPLVFTLIAELTPRRHRGWVAVTVGGIGGLGGYLAASEAARHLEPALTWRALWLIGLPSGLLLLLMAPLIPESPLYLLRAGRRTEAEAVLRRYGSHLGATPPVADTAAATRPGVGAMLRAYPVVTSVIGVVGVVWGLVNFGFLVMLPAQLREAGLAGGVASGLLADSALYSTPALALVVLLYAAWSGRRALALFIAITAFGLGGVALWTADTGGTVLLLASIGLLVLSLSAVNAMLLPYSAEIYPTAMRATGSGFAGAATKVGGILGPSTMLLVLSLGGGLVLPAVALGVLCLTAAGLLLVFGPELGASVGPLARRGGGTVPVDRTGTAPATGPTDTESPVSVAWPASGNGAPATRPAASDDDDPRDARTAATPTRT